MGWSRNNSFVQLQSVQLDNNSENGKLVFTIIVRVNSLILKCKQIDTTNIFFHLTLLIHVVVKVGECWGRRHWGTLGSAQMCRREADEGNIVLFSYKMYCVVWMCQHSHNSECFRRHSYLYRLKRMRFDEVHVFSGKDIRGSLVVGSFYWVTWIY